MITAKVEGLGTLSIKLAKMQMQCPEAIGKALVKAVEPTKDYAVGAVAVDSGSLARSITVRRMRNRDPGRQEVRIGPAWAVYEVNGVVEYGRFQEYGTAKMPAHPFLRPAFDAGKDEGLRIFAKEMKKAIK